MARSFRARVLAHRGRTDEAAEALTEALPAARQIEDLQVLGPVLLAAAITAGVDGDQAEAIARLQEFDAITEGGPTEYRELQLPEAVRVAIGAGQVELAERLVGDRPVHAPRTQMSVDMSRALVSEARGDFDDALLAFRSSAAAWDRWSVPLEHGHALMGAARCLRALDRSEEAETAESEGEGPPGCAGRARDDRPPNMTTLPPLGGSAVVEVAGSNPRPRTTVWDFSGRSQWKDLAFRLPPAEDLSASPGSMSLSGPRTEP